MRTWRLLGVLAIGLASGCGFQIKAVEAKIDTALPDYFTKRTIYSDAAAIQQDIPDFVGHVVYISDDGTATKAEITRLVKNDKKAPMTQIDPKTGNLYHSKIDTTFKSNNKISYLASITFDIDAESMMEVVVSDQASNNLASADVDADAVLEFARRDKPAGVVKRCFVQGALLANIQYRRFTKVSTSSKVAVGDVFSNGTDVFNSSDEFTQDYRISIDCVDLDKIKDLDSHGRLTPDALKELSKFRMDALAKPLRAQ